MKNIPFWETFCFQVSLLLNENNGRKFFMLFKMIIIIKTHVSNTYPLINESK